MPLSRRAISIFFPLLLLAATLAAYSPVMKAGFIWDDDSYVTENPIYNTAAPLHNIWFVPSASPQYYPVVFTTFYMERLLYGLNPLGYHLINVLLHAGSAILLWFVLKRLRVPGAMLAAAVFALHPIMVESVAWVTERKNTLSTFFFLASLLAFLKFALPKISGAPKPGESLAPALSPKSNIRWVWYCLSLLFFGIALASKSVACGLAPVLVLILWWKREGLTEYLVTLPYFVFGAAYGLFTAHFEETHVGAQGETWHHTVVEKILLASQALCFYFYKLLFPAQLSFFYWRWPVNPAVWWQWLFPTALVAVLALLIAFRRRIGDWPLVAAISFVALLFPALGFFPLYPMIFSWVADHFAYLSALAFIPAICAATVLAARRWLPGAALQMTLAAALLAALGAKTFITAGNYQSLESLWVSVLLYDPEHPHWVALNGMSLVIRTRGWAALRKGDRSAAAAANEQARALDEESLRVHPEYAEAYNNLAVYHMMNMEMTSDPTQIQREAALGLAMLEKAIALDPSQAMSYLTLGDIYADEGQWDKAAAAYPLAIAQDPNRPIFHFKMARALLHLDQVDRALPYLDNALQLDPNNEGALVLKGTIFVARNDYPRALEYFRKAVRLDPNDLEAADYFARAAVLSSSTSDADLDAAFDLANNNFEHTQGTNPRFMETLALLLRRNSQYAAAIALLQVALDKSAPDDPKARDALARELAAWKSQAAAPAPVKAPGPR